MNNLTHTQWDELYKTFLGSEQFIIRCLLNNELRYLEDNEYILEKFEKDRLQYLRDRKRDNGGSF